MNDDRTPCSCAPGICDPQRTQGLVAQVEKKEYDLISLEGPGLFVAADISKQGGTNGLTFVSLEIDGRNVVSISYAAVENLGLTIQNPYGIVLTTTAALNNLTIGFPQPLRYKKYLKLNVTVKEDNIAQILANVIHGS